MLTLTIVAVALFAALLGAVYYIQRKGSRGIHRALDAYELDRARDRHPSSRRAS